MKCERCKVEEARGSVRIVAEFEDDYEEARHVEKHRVCYPCGRDIIDIIAAEARAQKGGK